MYITILKEKKKTNTSKGKSKPFGIVKKLCKPNAYEKHSQVVKLVYTAIKLSKED